MRAALERVDRGGLGVPLEEGSMDARAPADRADVLRELGDLDDLDVEHILKLGPRVADLVEARVRLVHEDALDEPLRAPGPVVEQIVGIVRDAMERHAEDEDVLDATPAPP